MLDSVILCLEEATGGLTEGQQGAQDYDLLSPVGLCNELLSTHANVAQEDHELTV